MLNQTGKSKRWIAKLISPPTHKKRAGCWRGTSRLRNCNRSGAKKGKRSLFLSFQFPSRSSVWSNVHQQKNRPRLHLELYLENPTMLGAHKEESFSPMLGLGVNLFPRRFIFRTGIKGLLTQNSQTANQRRATTTVAYVFCISKNNSTRSKIGLKNSWGYRGAFFEFLSMSTSWRKKY